MKLDPELCKAINPDGIFASFRGARTLHDMLVHSKLPCKKDYTVQTPSVVSEQKSSQPSGGCFPCKNRCDLCKHFLRQTKTVTSFHTNSVFNINQNLDCDSKNVIYIINDIKCKISSVGCTSDSMKVRFRNHKSHIKTRRRTCEVSCHMIDNEVLHKLERQDAKSYTSSLSDNIEVILVEQVDTSQIAQDPLSRLSACKKREWFWQNQLKTLKQFGGLNVREERN